MDVAQFPKALASGIDDVEMSSYETRILNKDWSNYLFQSSYSQSFLSWRRRNLCMAAAFMFVSVGLQCYDLITVLQMALEDCKYTAIGLVGYFSQAIHPVVSWIMLMTAALGWTNYQTSRNRLVTGWVIGMILVFWPNLVPVDQMLKDRSFPQRAFVGVMNSLATLPMYLAIAGGMSKGARKVHAFSPSSLTGATIVLSAAFSLVIPFAVLSLVVQMIGDVMIVAGVFLLFLGQVVILWHSGLYTEITTQNTDQTAKVDNISRALQLTGFLLIVTWALVAGKHAVDDIITELEERQTIGPEETEEIIDAATGILDPVGILETVVQTIGNFIYQSVLWTDIFLHVSRNDDTKKKKLSTDLLHNSDES
jgi:hypothetical protein